MKMRIGYTTPLLALTFMLCGEYWARGQSSLSDPSYGKPMVGTPIGGPGPAHIPLGGAAGLQRHMTDLTENPDPNIKSFRQSGKKLDFFKAKLIEVLTLKDDKIITEVKGEVKDALTEHFAHDLAIRESELARLIKRADNAESQNKQRLDSKDELIELQLQCYVMEKDSPSLGSTNLDVQLLNDLGRVDQARTTGLDVSTDANDTFGRGGNSNDNVDPLADAFNSNRISGVQIGRNPQNPKAMIERARAKLAAAASAQEESQATDEVKEALVDYFSRDLEERDRLMKTVRTDIEKMKHKLEKRASSKNAIVELQFKMFVNEANGLGFFSPQVRDIERNPSSDSVLPR